MPIEECSNGTYTDGCSCHDVTGNSTFWIDPNDGVWLTFSAWNQDSHLMHFTYTMDIAETVEEFEEVSEEESAHVERRVEENLKLSTLIKLIGVSLGLFYFVYTC